MKENKNLKNQYNSDKNQTPPPAVPNRANTEMKNEKNNKKEGAQSSNSKNCR